MKKSLLLILLGLAAAAQAAEPQSPALPASEDAQTSEAVAKQQARFDQAFKSLIENPQPSPERLADFKPAFALLLLFKQERVEEANRMIVDYCAAWPNPRRHTETMFRIALLQQTRRLLSPEALEAIEDQALKSLTTNNIGMPAQMPSKFETAALLLPNNGLSGLWRRTTQALDILHQAKRYGPDYKLEGETIAAHVKAWTGFWLRFFRTFPREGVDMDIAHSGSYAAATMGVFYDLYDLANDAEVRRLAGNFISLYWADVVAEFDPRTVIRGGMATTRVSTHKGVHFWARALLSCYDWHDNEIKDFSLTNLPFYTSSYRPPAILTAIARNAERGSYLSTSRRPGMIGGSDPGAAKTWHSLTEQRPTIIFDKDGNSNFRRDIYYTPDYTMGTLATDPKLQYISELILTPMMGATFPTDEKDRVAMTARGFYPVRSNNGITGRAVSIIARDPNAEFGQGRFKSDGTRVFISSGELWNNRVEDVSGWFFTRIGNAYVAVRAATGGYQISDMVYTWPNRTLQEAKETTGFFLDLNDMWSPIILQMGQAKDYASFEAFQASVKDNPFVFEDGKLTYTSEADDTYEAWSKITQLPAINGTTINLNPPKTYDSPFLSMEHGSDKAVIKYPGYDDLILKF